MVWLIVLTVLLAQANDFVTFDICRVDFTAHPPEARHDRELPPISVRPRAVTGYQSLPRHWSGIACVKVAFGVHTKFVVGTEGEVRAKLEE